MSTRSGTEDCMRKAISYYVMRVCVFGVTQLFVDALIHRLQAVQHQTTRPLVDAARIGEVTTPGRLGRENANARVLGRQKTHFPRGVSRAPVRAGRS